MASWGSRPGCGTRPGRYPGPGAGGPPPARLSRPALCYPGARRDVFAGLDLDIAPGAITAILGGNGAGKSTLIKLLCRLYDPQDGSITLGGVDLRDLGQADLGPAWRF